MIRKVRDHDTESKALSDKARSLKAKWVEQPGQLGTDTFAGALGAEALAGAPLDAVGPKDAST